MSYIIKINGKIKRHFIKRKTLTGFQLVYLTIESFDKAVEFVEYYHKKDPTSYIVAFNHFNEVVYSVRPKNLFDL